MTQNFTNSNDKRSLLEVYDSKSNIALTCHKISESAKADNCTEIDASLCHLSTVQEIEQGDFHKFGPTLKVVTHMNGCGAMYLDSNGNVIGSDASSSEDGETGIPGYDIKEAEKDYEICLRAGASKTKLFIDGDADTIETGVKYSTLNFLTAKNAHSMSRRNTDALCEIRKRTGVLKYSFLDDSLKERENTNCSTQLIATTTQCPSCPTYPSTTTTTQMPQTTTKCPACPTCPTQPIVTTQELQTTTQCPACPTQPIITTTQCPACPTQPIITTTQCPACPTQPIITTTNCPTCPTQEPCATAEQCPVCPTQPIITTTQCPACPAQEPCAIQTTQMPCTTDNAELLIAQQRISQCQAGLYNCSQSFMVTNSSLFAEREKLDFVTIEFNQSRTMLEATSRNLSNTEISLQRCLSSTQAPVTETSIASYTCPICPTQLNCSTTNGLMESSSIAANTTITEMTTMFDTGNTTSMFTEESFSRSNNITLNESNNDIPKIFINPKFGASIGINSAIIHNGSLLASTAVLGYIVANEAKALEAAELIAQTGCQIVRSIGRKTRDIFHTVCSAVDVSLSFIGSEKQT